MIPPPPNSTHLGQDSTWLIYSRGTFLHPWLLTLCIAIKMMHGCRPTYCSPMKTRPIRELIWRSRGVLRCLSWLAAWRWCTFVVCASESAFNPVLHFLIKLMFAITLSDSWQRNIWEFGDCASWTSHILSQLLFSQMFVKSSFLVFYEANLESKSCGDDVMKQFNQVLVLPVKKIMLKNHWVRLQFPSDPSTCR